MGRHCTVCTHPEREAIDQALVAGASYRDIAERFSLSAPSVHRHASRHLPGALIKAQEVGEVARADNLLGQVRDLQARALAILSQAEAAGDLKTALHAIREARGTLELLAKMLCEVARLSNAPQVIQIEYVNDWRTAGDLEF